MNSNNLRGLKQNLKNIRGVAFFAACLLIPFLALTPRASGQVDTATVVGTVADMTGGVIPGAVVKIQNTGTQASRNANAGTDGAYTFSELQPGTYTISITATGFKAFVESDIKLAAGDRTRVDAKLQLGATTETVEVTGQASALQTDSTSVGSSLEGKSIQDLPLNGRNVYGLVQIAPGVTAGNPSSQASGTKPADRRQSSSVSANGLDEHSNNNMIDGMDNNERMKGLILLRPSIDAIDQVSVSTNLNNAEIARAPGASIDIFSKSGTDSFHGTVYEFFRNNIWDARNYFASTGPKPELRQNQFGGSVGGPIRKGKTFFFADLEKFLQIDATTAGATTTVPTLFEEQNPGNLSDIGGPVIAPATIDPTALAYWKLYPAPNQPGRSVNGAPINNFFAAPPLRGNTTTGDMRIDRHISDNDQAFLRYSYNGLNMNIPALFPAVNGVYPGGVGGNQPANVTEDTNSVELAYTHIFSPKMVGTAHAGYTLFINTSLPWDFGQNLNNAGQAYAIPNANNCIACSGLAQVTPAPGYETLGDNTFVPLMLDEHVYQGMGDLTYTPGNQSIKAGFSYIHREVGNLQHPNAKGAVTFPNSNAIASLEGFFAGGPFTYTRQDMLQKLYERTDEYGIYLQDDWRILSRLTLNLGVRYDIFTPANEQNGNYSNLDLNTFQLIQSHTGGITTSYIDFGPRVGFAWSVKPTTVVRGGFGMTFYPSDLGNGFLLLNPPYSFASGIVSYAGKMSAGVDAPVAPSTTNLKGSVSTKWPLNYLNAYFEQFNLVVQHNFDGNTLSVGYLATMGKHLFDQISNWNLPPASGSSIVPALRYKAELPGINSIVMYGNFGASNYNALQVSLVRQLSRGVAITGSYTWSHSIDDYINVADGDTWGFQPQLISTYDRGNGSLDVRQRVAFTINFAVPHMNFGNGLVKQVVNHWQFNVLSYWQTGLPFTVVDNLTQGPQHLSYINLPTVKSGDRPNLTGHGFKTGTSGPNFFNPAAFQPQPVGTLGDVGRNSFHGPHLTRTDFSLFRTFPIHKQLAAEFRAEAFNIMNTPIFANPNNAIAGLNPDGTASSAGSFGITTETATGTTGRQLQFALKFLF